MIISLKSQITVEFMVFSGIALIATIVFISISTDHAQELYATREFLLLKDVALKIQSEISLSADVEDGYSRGFKLPEDIGSKNYNISIVNNTLIVWTNTTNANIRVLNITGYLKKGTNTISKTNGVIRIN